LGVVAWDWMAEYTRIEPWVYTHHLGASHRYTHFGQNLGSDLGPNSQEIYSKLGMEFAAFRLDLHVSSVAHDTARGGNITDIHAYVNELGIPPDRSDKTFLDDASTNCYREYGATLTWRPVPFFWIRSGNTLYRGDYHGFRVETSSGIEW